MKTISQTKIENARIDAEAKANAPIHTTLETILVTLTAILIATLAIGWILS